MTPTQSLLSLMRAKYQVHKDGKNLMLQVQPDTQSTFQLGESSVLSLDVSEAMHWPLTRGACICSVAGDRKARQQNLSRLKKRIGFPE